MSFNFGKAHIKKIAGVFFAAVMSVSCGVTAFCTDGTVTGNSVNVRSAASTSASVIGSYNSGQSVNLLNVEGDWYKISYNGGIAYISKQFVKIEPVTYYATVNCDGLNFRKTPDVNGEIIKLLPQGYNLDITKNCDDWMQVKDGNGNVGYVNTEYITVSKGKAPANGDETGVISSSYSSKGAEVAAYAQKYVGLRYVYGGTSLSSGTDCSGFTSAIYRNFGVTLNRTSRSQMSNGVAVSKADIQPGDLVLFDDGYQVDHVGMYIGNNQYIHNSMNAGKVVISNFSGPYVTNHLAGIRRVI